MPKPDEELSKRYEIGNGPVHVSVTIGKGQDGITGIFLDDVLVKQGGNRIRRFEVGAGAGLAGKKLVIRSLVRDARTETNRMIVTYDLEGGPEAKEFELSGQVEEEADSLYFRATFKLSHSQ